MFDETLFLSHPQHRCNRLFYFNLNMSQARESYGGNAYGGAGGAQGGRPMQQQAQKFKYICAGMFVAFHRLLASTDHELLLSRVLAAFT